MTRPIPPLALRIGVAALAIVAVAAACNGDAEVLDVTPTPTVTATPTASPTAAVTSTPTPTAEPTPAATAEPTPTATPETTTPAATPQPTPRATAAPTQPPATPTPAPATPTPAPATPTPSTPSGVTAEIRGFGYPWELEVTAGTTVTWINRDGVPHDVEAYDGSFKSPILGQDESWSRTFTTAGTFAYFCSVHPYMQASVIVR